MRLQPVLISLVVAMACLRDLPAQSSASDSLTEADLRVLEGTELGKTQEEMLAGYFLRQAAEATKSRLARLGALHSEADIRAWQQENRRKFIALIGGLPEVRGPLNARVTGELRREGYVVRKVIFESLPEFYVTADLYIPTSGKGPFPAVLSPCGHSRNGKAYDVYQHLYIGLARRGYVVLSWDPLGQGERVLYWDFLNNRRRFTFNQHGMAGIQEYLLGWNLARFFIWDGMRALDYLESLPEVDRDRIGVTGNSGGGTLTTYVSMLDPRVKAASIVTFITSIPKKIEARINDAESDPEQDVAGLLAEGLDHTEFVGMMAPRPVQIGAATQDFFPIEGTRQTFRELKGLYEKLGHSERIRMVEFNHRHEYSQPLREATYSWFDHWLKGLPLEEAHEPPITTEKDAALEGTTTGQVVTSLGGKTVYDFNRDEAGRLGSGLARRRESGESPSGLTEAIRRRLALPGGAIQARATSAGAAEAGEFRAEKFLLETEPGIVVPVRVIYSRNLPRPAPAVVYLRDRRGENDSVEIFETLARAGRVVAVADVRGFGETMSRRNVPEQGVDYFDPRDGMDADFTYASFFLGRPILGMRVWDALHVLAYMRSRQEVDPHRVGIAGRGWAGLVALFAAAVDPEVSSLAVEGTPANFAEIANAELYSQPASLLLPGALQDFDLQDVVRAVLPRPVLVINPADELTRKMTKQEAESAFESLSKAGGAQGFSVRVYPLERGTREGLTSWLLQN